jgi:hypothetical protein
MYTLGREQANNVRVRGVKFIFRDVIRPGLYLPTPWTNIAEGLCSIGGLILWLDV